MIDESDGWIGTRERKPQPNDFPVWAHNTATREVRYVGQFFDPSMWGHWQSVQPPTPPPPPAEPSQRERDLEAYADKAIGLSTGLQIWHAALAYRDAQVREVLETSFRCTEYDIAGAMREKEWRQLCRLVGMEAK